jgi:hypothetical protein
MLAAALIEHVECLLEHTPALRVFIDHKLDLALYLVYSVSIVTFFQEQVVEFTKSMMQG